MEQLNLTLKGEETFNKFSVRYSEDGEIQNSKEELIQIMESQRKEIKYQTLKCKRLEEEKEQLIDNF